MLSKIIDFSIKNRLIVLLGLLALVLGGAYSLSKLPIDAVPDITNNQVLVITSAPSAGAQDVERYITVPLEQATRNIPGIIEQRSFSRFGLSLLTIVFEDKVDIYWARQQVAEKIMAVKSQIPEGMGVPELGPLTTGLGEIYQYVVRPEKGFEKKYSLMELRTIQDWIVRKQLLGTPGVADVSSFGGAVKQYQVLINTEVLKNHGLSVNDVYTVLNKNNQNAGGTYIEHNAGVLFIRTEGMVSTIEQIESIPVKTLPSGIPLLIKDVAKVDIGEAVKFGATAYNATGEVAGAVVMMIKGGNSKMVIDNIKTRIATIQKTLPEGVVIEPFLDRTKMVDNAISTVAKNLLEGALIVIFVLIFFLGNYRAGIIVASVIPLSMLFAFILMNLFGVSGNLMSLGALDFGLLVDGAVIIVEAVLHYLYHPSVAEREELSHTDTSKIVGNVSKKMMNAAVFGQIIILIVYLPILSLTGIEGKMFRPMAETVSFALVGAFLLSLTYVPMMSAWLLKKKTITKEPLSDRLMRNLERFYEPLLIKALAIPKKILIITISVFVVSIVVLSSLGGEFIPKLEEGDFAVDTRTLSGSSLHTTLDATQKASKLLIEKFPEVKKVVTKIGSGEIPTDPMSMDASDLMIILKDKKEWVSAKSFDELADTMSKVMASVPGITTGFQFPVQMRFNELMTGSRQDVSCKIFGDNLDTLSKYANQIGAIINKIDGAKDLYVETVTGVSQVVIKYKREALARYGASVQDVNSVIQSAYAGGVAGKVFEGERRFDLVVKMNETQKKDWSQIQNIMVAVANGKQVPLYELADVKIEEGPYQIQREDAARRIIVGFNVRGRDVKSIVNELQQKAQLQMKLPSGYYVVYGGQFENLEHAISRLEIAVPIALLLILLMLFFAFNNITQSLLVFSAIPFSAIGGVFALWLRGMPFSISAGVGFIALFGVAVLNGIVLITEFNKIKLEHANTSTLNIILSATKTRLRPILITASVASLGFIPMAISHGAGAEVQKPLATVVIGGLITATFLTLFVLPILYQMIEKRNHLKMKALILLPLLLLLHSKSNAQELPKKTLQEVVSRAIEVSPQMKTSEAQIAYYEALSQNKFDVSKSIFKYDIGNLNSSNVDNKITFEQVVDLPVVYNEQQAVYKTMQKASVAQNLLDKNFVKMSTEQMYFRLQALVSKGKLFHNNLTIYKNLMKAVDARFKTGQDNILEKVNLQNWIGLHEQEVIKNDMNLKTLQRQFRIVLNESTDFEPADTLVNVRSLIDTVITASHPMLNLLNSKIEVAEHESKLIKAKTLPQLSFGATNQTFNTLNADKSRYNAFSVGINISIFSNVNKQKIKASKINQSQLESEKERVMKDLQLNIEKAYGNLLQSLEMAKFVTKELLPNANKLATLSTKSFQLGQISYLEWSNAQSQSAQTELQYIDHLESIKVQESYLNHLLSK
jgi:cobalt-zinc-cadmium resistance protein CzcA